MADRWFVERQHPALVAHRQVDGPMSHLDAQALKIQWSLDQPALPVQLWQHPEDEAAEAAQAPPSARERLEASMRRLQEFVAAHVAPGGCRMLSQGPGCTCIRCDLDVVLRAAAREGTFGQRVHCWLRLRRHEWGVARPSKHGAMAWRDCQACGWVTGRHATVPPDQQQPVGHRP